MFIEHAVLICVSIVLFSIVFMAVSSDGRKGHNSPKNNRAGTSNADGNANNNLIVSWRIAKVLSRFYHNAHKNEQESRQDRLNKRTANATVMMTIFTAALVGVGIVQFDALRGQQRAMQRQLDVMQADQRPWIGISFEPTGPLIFEKDGGSIDSRFTLKNTGHTPAIAVSVWSEVYFPDTVEEILDRQNRICDTFELGGTGDYGQTIFPGETVDFDQDALLFQEDIDKGRSPIIGIGLFRNPTIGVCVRYKFSFDITTSHRTSLAWQLFRKPDGARILPDKTVPLSELMINSRSRMGIGDHAD